MTLRDRTSLVYNYRNAASSRRQAEGAKLSSLLFIRAMHLTGGQPASNQRPLSHGTKASLRPRKGQTFLTFSVFSSRVAHRPKRLLMTAALGCSQEARSRTLQVTQPAIFPARWAYSGRAEELQLGTASYGKPQTSPAIRGGKPFFIEKWGEWEGCFELKSIGGKLEARVGIASHWLSCCIFLLAELVARPGEVLPASCQASSWEVELRLPIGLQLRKSCTSRGLPLLASHSIFPDVSLSSFTDMETLGRSHPGPFSTGWVPPGHTAHPGVLLMKMMMSKWLRFTRFWKTNRYRRDKKFEEEEEKPKKIL